MKTSLLQLGAGLSLWFGRSLAVTVSNASSTSDITTTIHLTSILTETLTSLVPATTQMCCFVAQDTVTEAYWERISYSTFYTLVNLTSISTLITPYPSSTLTAYETNVYTTNGTFSVPNYLTGNPVSLFTNDGHNPAQATTFLNGTETQTVTGGVTVASPTGFVVYSTLKIFTAAAVTDSKGNVACGTLSTFEPAETVTETSIQSSFSTSTGTPYTTTITQPLYSTLPGDVLQETAAATITTVETPLYTSETIYDSGLYTTTYSSIAFSNINSNAEQYFEGGNSSKPIATALTLTEPFVYVPDRGSIFTSGTDQCSQGPYLEGYGYPYQAVISYLAANPFYSSQYPGIESCLPAGPAVIQLSNCSQASPEVASAGGDFTSATVITVLPSTVASAAPGSTGTTTLPTSTSTTQAAPTTTQQPASTSSVVQPTSTSTSVPALPESQSTSTTDVANPAPTTSSTTTNPAQPAPESSSTTSTTEQVLPVQTSSSTSAASPASNPAESNPVPTEGTTSTSSAVSAGNPAESNPVPTQGTTTTSAAVGASNPAASNPVSTSTDAAGNPVVVNPTSSSTNTAAAAVASQIASIVGASPLPASPTLISGSSEFIISATATIPLPTNPSISVTLSGLTTVISGTTNVIISTLETIPASSVLASLPGTTTSLSGGGLGVVVSVTAGGTSLVPVNSNLPGLTGVTTTSAGSIFVEVTGVTTIPVVAGTGSASTTSKGSGNGTSSTGLPQITAGSGAGRVVGETWSLVGMGVLGMLGVMGVGVL